MGSFRKGTKLAMMNSQLTLINFTARKGRNFISTYILKCKGLLLMQLKRVLGESILQN